MRNLFKMTPACPMPHAMRSCVCCQRRFQSDGIGFELLQNHVVLYAGTACEKLVRIHHSGHVGKIRYCLEQQVLATLHTAMYPSLAFHRQSRP